MIDLGLHGKRALICGSSAGLGFACAEALARSGATVILNGRDEARLMAAAERLREAGATAVELAVGSVANAEGRAVVLAAAGDCDILVNNAGGPPPGNYQVLDEAQYLAAFQENALAAIMLTKALIDPMRARGWGRIINITSGSVKYPNPQLALSNTARMGLTGFMAGLAREVAPSGVTVNSLLPGSFMTDRLRSYAATMAERQGTSEDEQVERMVANIPAGRAGDPSEFGWWCAFLASSHSGYVTGQNIMIDGGWYPGSF